MTDLERRLRNELNEAQFQAVTTTDGPVLVIAGAGSGKTRVPALGMDSFLERVINFYAESEPSATTLIAPTPRQEQGMEQKPKSNYSNELSTPITRPVGLEKARELKCAKCGTLNPPGSSFCCNCGSRLSTIEPIAPREPAPEPPQVGSSKDLPIRVGASWLAPDGNELTVLGFKQNLTSQLKAFNPYVNINPGRGKKHVLATVKVRCLRPTKQVTSISPMFFAIVGSSGRLIDADCISPSPEKPLWTDLVKGGVAEGELVFTVPDKEKDMVLVYKVDPFGIVKHYFLSLPQ